MKSASKQLRAPTMGCTGNLGGKKRRRSSSPTVFNSIMRAAATCVLRVLAGRCHTCLQACSDHCILHRPMHSPKNIAAHQLSSVHLLNDQRLDLAQIGHRRHHFGSVFGVLLFLRCHCKIIDAQGIPTCTGAPEAAAGCQASWPAQGEPRFQVAQDQPGLCQR